MTQSTARRKFETLLIGLAIAASAFLFAALALRIPNAPIFIMSTTGRIHEDAVPDYHVASALCLPNRGRIIPHLLYFYV